MGIWDDYKKSLKATGGKVKKVNYGNTMQTAGASSGAPLSMPKAGDTLPKVEVGPVQWKKPTSMPSLSRVGEPLPKVEVPKIGLAAEKASRYYAQNGPDMSVIKPKTVAPADRYAMERAYTPKMSVLDRAKSANNKANNAYLQATTFPKAMVSLADRYTMERGYMPKVSVMDRVKSANDKANNAYLAATGQLPRVPEYMPGVGKELAFMDRARAANNRANNAYLLRTEIMPTAARQGSGALDRVYNAISSIGDSKIGADMSLKAVAKQSAKNEAEYMRLLKESGEQIDALIQAREKYSPTSKEYRKYNSKINQLYNKIDAFRDRPADMTEANRFMSNAANLRAEATKGMGTAGRSLTEAAISVGDNLTTMALTGFNPAASLALMGVSAAGQRANELSNAGVSARDAFGRGAVSGIIEGLTEKIGMDNLMDIVAGRKTGLLANILKQAASEGAEEGIGSLLNYWADAAAGDRKSFDWNEAAQAVMQGMISGFMFGVGGTVVNGVMPRAVEYAPRAADMDNANIGNMSAIEYLDSYNKALNGGKEVMMPRADENTTPQSATSNIKEVKSLPNATYTEIVDFVNNGVENKNKSQYLKIAETSSRLVNDLKKIGLNVSKFVHALKDNNIRHIDKSHGSKSNDKYKVGMNEYLLLNDIYENYDALYRGYNTKEGNIAIAFEKRYDNKIYVVEEVFEEGVLSPKQIIITGADSKPSFLKKYAKISGEPDTDVAGFPRSTDYKSPPSNHVPDASSTADNIIPEPSQKINTQAAETRIFDGSGDDLDLSGTLSDTDVSAYNFIKKTAEQKNVSEKKVYEAYKKGRDVLFNSIVDETFEVYKKYRPQGTQLINTTENMGGGTLDRMQRISNNEKWYSEAYKEYGRKPNQSQLRQFIEKKVEADIRRGGGEYMDSATAKKLNTFDALLSGYDKITENGTRDVADIRKGNNGAYEVGYNIPEADKRSKKERLNDSASIISKLKDSIPALSEMEPVSKITGTEFQKGTERITDTVGRFFASLGNKVFRKGFGNIVIDVDGIKDSIAHGIGKRKAAAFKAVPDILAMGEQIDVQSNWKGRNYDTYVFAAPIQVGNEINYVAAVVKNSGSSNRYYLHEVVDQSGNIIYSNKKSDGNNDSSAIGFKTTSIGANNPSLNNSIPKTSEKNNNNLGIISPEMQQLFEASETAKKSFEKAYQFGVSGTAPFERMAKADTRENARNINALSNKYSQKGGIVNTLLTEGMYDINGNKVDGRSFVQVASQVPKNQLAAFNDYWHELHNIDRQAQGKPVTEHTAEQSKEIVKNYEAQHPEFKEYLKNISDYYDLFIRTWGIGSGIISEKSYLQMKQMYPYYVPTFRVDDGVAGSGGYAQGKKIRNGNAIGKAKGGTQEVISFDEAFARKINSVVAAATKNDISREIFSFAQAMPAEAARNGVLIETDKGGQYSGQMDIDDLMDSIDQNIAREISKGKYEITFYNNGKPQTMKINKDVWNAFNFLDDRLGGEGYRFFAGLGRKLTNPMRAMTTTYNPLFFLTNLMRDAQTYTINNTASNSLVAMKNYVRAIKHIVRGADTFDQYKALGGSQNGYYGTDMYKQAYRSVNPGAKSAGQKALGALRSPLTLVEELGEFTEKIPRYAEYLNTIDRLGNTDAGRLQASLNAADVTVNFNRSSTLSSMANAWVPYFNAGLQGMDKTFRQIKAHPIQTGARAMVSVFLPTLLLYLVNKDNPYWEDVKDGVRDNYYLMPNPMGPYDENGNAETFIRLPKSREFGALFSASFERFMRAINSEDTKNVLPDAFDGYLDTLLNSVMPNSVLDDNIFGAMKRLGTNTAWHGGKIVPSNLENVSPRYQYDINTSGAAMRLAGMAQSLPFVPDWTKSPMKLDYVIDSYGGYAGDLLQGITSRKNIGATDAETVKNSLYNGFIQPFKNRFNTDSVYSNYNLDRFYDMTDALEMAANDRNMAENLPPEYKTPEESVYSDFVSARGDITDITKQERAVLETPMSMAEKNRQIRELKKQKSEIAKGMMEDKDRLYENYKAEYLPELSVQNEKKQEKLRDLQSSYNMPDSTLNNILANYNSIKKIPDDKKSDLEKTIDFYNYLDSIGYTSDYAVRDDLDELLRYGNVAQSQVEKYNSVSGFISPDEYENLGKYLDDITWEKGKSGAKSIALKNGIDDWIQYYGLNLSGNERRSLYLSQGVGKSYTY